MGPSAVTHLSLGGRRAGPAIPPQTHTSGPDREGDKEVDMHYGDRALGGVFTRQKILKIIVG